MPDLTTPSSAVESLGGVPLDNHSAGEVMAHVQLRVGSAAENGKTAQLIIDGVDVTNHVLASPFSIETTGDGPADKWVVKLAIAAGTLDADLPEAVIEALRVTESDEAAS